MRRFPEKRDAAEADIVKALRAAGWTVHRWSAKGCPDLVCGRHGVTMLVEVKSGPKAKLRPLQEAFNREWRGDPVIVLRSVEDALRLLQSEMVAGEPANCSGY